jgi:hypothetical protein
MTATTDSKRMLINGEFVDSASYSLEDYTRIKHVMAKI